jgi:hypothetical protein
MRDIHNELKFSRGISPVAATTDNTAYASQICDTDDTLGNEFVGLLGAVADADATFTVLVEDGDAADLSDAAAVADSQLLGVEAGTVTAGAAVSGAAPGFADDNKTFKIGYKGAKRYWRVTITPANNTGNLFLAGVFAQAMRTIPQSTQVA